MQKVTISEIAIYSAVLLGVIGLLVFAALKEQHTLSNNKTHDDAPLSNTNLIPVRHIKGSGVSGTTFI